MIISASKKIGCLYLLLFLFLFAATIISFHSTLVAVTENIALPHLSIKMCCSEDIQESYFDYISELEDYFGQIYPSATDVQITSGRQVVSNSTEFEG